MDTLIYESNKPVFAIFCDDLQWMLAMKKRKDGRWDDFTYYPTITLLIDSLTEMLFRKLAHKVEHLGELQAVVDEVYKITGEMYGDMNFCKVLERAGWRYTEGKGK